MEDKLKFLPLGILFAFGIKGLALGMSWETVAISAIASALYIGLEYKAKDSQYKALEEKLKLIDQANKERDLIINDLRSGVSSLRLTNGLNAGPQRSFSGLVK